MGCACQRATMLSRNRRCTQKTRVSHGPTPPRRHPPPGPCSTTQIDEGLRLSAGHDAQPEPTRYPEDTGLTRPHPAPAPPSARTVFDHANRRRVAPVSGPRCSAGTDAVPRRHGSHTAPPRPGATQRQGRVRTRKSTTRRACQRATMLSRNRRCTQKTRVSHGPAPPRHHPAPGPCSTTQIDDASRLSAGHDAQPEPTRYPEDTGLTRPRPAPAPPSARTVFDHANRRRVAPVSGPRCSAGTDAVPRRHGSHTAPAPPRGHPALGPCSTTQIDDGLRLSAGHDAQPEPTQYAEDTGLT